LRFEAEIIRLFSMAGQEETGEGIRGNIGFKIHRAFAALKQDIWGKAEMRRMC